MARGCPAAPARRPVLLLPLLSLLLLALACQHASAQNVIQSTGELVLAWLGGCRWLCHSALGVDEGRAMARLSSLTFRGELTHSPKPTTNKQKQVSIASKRNLSYVPRQYIVTLEDGAELLPTADGEQPSLNVASLEGAPE